MDGTRRCQTRETSVRVGPLALALPHVEPGHPPRSEFTQRFAHIPAVGACVKRQIFGGPITGPDLLDQMSAIKTRLNLSAEAGCDKVVQLHQNIAAVLSSNFQANYEAAPATGSLHFRLLLGTGQHGFHPSRAG